MSTPTISVEHTDPINAEILAVSEDQIQGFSRDPITQISERCGHDIDTVIIRIRAMLEAGTIRRVRQTLLSTNLAPGALVAWTVPDEKLDFAFDWLFKNDPFSGHVVVRSTDKETAGSQYKLWTTLKVPQGYSMEKHCEFLCSQTGATKFRLMPAKGIFALGVGHTRRRNMEPGAKSDDLAVMKKVEVAKLTDRDWQVLVPLKEELTPEEVSPNLWKIRAEKAGMSFEDFCSVAEDLNARGVIGRFSTFLEHVKPSQTGKRVTRFNGLFHWAVPQGRELEAGREAGRHDILTHCYWREGGSDFKNVNIMAVAHGMEKDKVLLHKEAIDKHLESVGIPVTYTNVFWGGRSEIKPSEISPQAYAEFCKSYELNSVDFKA